MKVKRKIIEIDDELCDGCGDCTLSCAEGALEIIDGKAKVISDNLCDGLGACIGECPTGALRIIEREADEFDEAAVEKHLETRPQNESPASPFPTGGCPSASIQQFGQEPAMAKQPLPTTGRPTNESSLGHWPVQVRLVPPTAPFLKNADLLVVADCVPVAYPDLHKNFLKGRAIMLGCPKFDDTQEYIDKFAQICSQSGIKSITTLIIEVPCCSGLPVVVKKGMDIAGKNIPMKEIVISTRGQILSENIIQ